MANQKSEPSKLIVVGALVGAHGVRGDVKVKSFTAAPENAFSYGPLLDGSGEAVLEPRTVRRAKAFFIVTPKSPRTREDWDAMKGTRLHVPFAVLPETEDNEVYVDELVGLNAFAPDGETLGRVKAVQNFGAGDLLEIAPEGSGQSVLIPFTEDDVPEIDIAAGALVITSWDLWTEDGGA